MASTCGQWAVSSPSYCCVALCFLETTTCTSFRYSCCPVAVCTALFARWTVCLSVKPQSVCLHPIHPCAQLICETIGSPTAADLHFVTSDAARNYMMRQPKCAPVPFASVFPHVRGPCLDLLERMLKFDPAKRITVDVSAAIRMWMHFSLCAPQRTFGQVQPCLCAFAGCTRPSFPCAGARSKAWCLRSSCSQTVSIGLQIEEAHCGEMVSCDSSRVVFLVLMPVLAVCLCPGANT
jgi:hypothetical protein